MFGFFKKKKKPQNAPEDSVFSIYGNPPPAKRANVNQAVTLATELLMNIVDEKELSRTAIALNDGPIPYSTHDLALSIALKYFKQAEYVPQLFMAQLSARMKALKWHQEKLVGPVFVKSFEDVLYKLYRPR